MSGSSKSQISITRSSWVSSLFANFLTVFSYSLSRICFMSSLASPFNLFIVFSRVLLECSNGSRKSFFLTSRFFSYWDFFSFLSIRLWVCSNDLRWLNNLRKWIQWFFCLVSKISRPKSRSKDSLSCITKRLMTCIATDTHGSTRTYILKKGSQLLC